MIERIAAVLRQKKAVQTLIPDLTTELVKIVAQTGSTVLMVATIE